MSDKDSFKNNPRDYALRLVDEGCVDPGMMLVAALNWMSCDEVREMLDANELSPRFMSDEDEDIMDDFNYPGSRHHY